MNIILDLCENISLDLFKQNAMYTMNISNEQQAAILQLIAGILHLGNIFFDEVGNYAQPKNDDCKIFVCLI